MTLALLRMLEKWRMRAGTAVPDRAQSPTLRSLPSKKLMEHNAKTASSHAHGISSHTASSDKHTAAAIGSKALGEGCWLGEGTIDEKAQHQ